MAELNCANMGHAYRPVLVESKLIHDLEEPTGLGRIKASTTEQKYVLACRKCADVQPLTVTSKG